MVEQLSWCAIQWTLAEGIFDEGITSVYTILCISLAIFLVKSHVNHINSYIRIFFSFIVYTNIDIPLQREIVLLDLD